jgi:predicted phosphodiesterase
MKIWTFSDPHIDVGHNRRPFKLPDPKPEADVLVVAGDIREGLCKSLTWLDTCTGWKDTIIYVAGNHDFYKTEIDKERRKAREHLDKINQSRAFRGCRAIHLLQDSWMQFDGVRFIGATLWTDYEVEGYGWKEVAMMTANSGMNDHRLIRKGPDYRKFLAKDALAEHMLSRAYIYNALLDCPKDITPVVVTHHAPSRKSIDFKRYAGNILNAAYSSNLEFMAGLARLWVHGHTHHSFDYPIGDCRVICNPRGYTDDNTDFNPSLVIEVPNGTTPLPTVPNAAGTVQVGGGLDQVPEVPHSVREVRANGAASA